MKNFLQNKNYGLLVGKRGFTMIEVIVAISILITGLVGILSLASSSLKFSFVFKNKLVASNLAAEGVELVFKIRNDNWLAKTDWRTDLASGDYEIDSDGDGNVRILTYAGRFLKIDNSGLYNYFFGADTMYSRKIAISDGGVDPLNEIKVVSTVTWADHGSVRSISLEDRLWNWK